MVGECPPLGKSPHAWSQMTAAADVIRTTDATRHIFVMHQDSWFCPYCNSVASFLSKVTVYRIERLENAALSSALQKKQAFIAVACIQLSSVTVCLDQLFR